MHVLVFFTESAQKAGSRLQKIIEDVVPKKLILYIHSVDDLRRHLCCPKGWAHTAVLVAANRMELERLTVLEPLLTRYRIILIVWENDMETLTEGHKLRPRFLTYIDGDLRDVGSVLARILKEYISTNKKARNTGCQESENCPELFIVTKNNLSSEQA